MLISVESDNFEQAQELATKYIEYLCGEGIPTSMLVPDNRYQTSVAKEFKDSPGLGVAMVNARSLDFLLNGNYAHTKMQNCDVLVCVNYCSYGPADYRVRGNAPNPDVVFHLVPNNNEIIYDKQLHNYCNMNAMNYIRVVQSEDVDIKMMFVFIRARAKCVEKVKNGGVHIPMKRTVTLSVDEYPEVIAASNV